MGTPTLRVDNLREGQVLGYPLLRLTGQLTTAGRYADGFIQVRALLQGQQRGGGEEEREAVNWPVIGGQFKALVLLQRGHNTIYFLFLPSVPRSSGSTISPITKRPTVQVSRLIGLIRGKVKHASSSCSPSPAAISREEGLAATTLQMSCCYDPLIIHNRLGAPSSRSSPSIVSPSELARSSREGEGTEEWRQFVRLVYLVAKDDPQELDAAGKANVERLALGALLLQAFCAQNIEEESARLSLPAGPITFGLELASGRPGVNWPVVHVIRSRSSSGHLIVCD